MSSHRYTSEDRLHQDALVGEEVPTCFLRVFVPFSLGHSQNKRAKEALNQP